MKPRLYISLPFIFLTLIWASCTEQESGGSDHDRIKPSTQNPGFWQYQGRPIMLLGANKTDSPYLLPDQEAYYDELAALGGNYTRYVVKQRLDPSLVHLFPYKKLPDGRYDLNEWDGDYWDRFERGLLMTQKRDIIVQLELWDRFDIGSETFYKASPWKPDNNSTYSEQESGLPSEWPGTDSAVHRHPFFSSVPGLDNNQLLLDLQKRHADKVLSISLKFNHVLYVITNESTLDLEWSKFWARHILDRAELANKKVEVSEMPWTIADRFPFPWQQTALVDPNKWINHVIESPGLYSFCAFQFQPIISSGQDHYDRLSEIHARARNSSVGPRPLNGVKVFARERIIGSKREPNAQTRFWRPLMAGWAALSLHREHPNSGYLGFSEPGQRNLSAARKFCDAITPWECSPRQDLLRNREPDKAYLLASPGKAYGVYFPTTGSVELDLNDESGTGYTLRWINIETGDYAGEPIAIDSAPSISLQTPDSAGNAGWAAALVARGSR